MEGFDIVQLVTTNAFPAYMTWRIFSYMGEERKLREESNKQMTEALHGVKEVLASLTGKVVSK